MKTLAYRSDLCVLRHATMQNKADLGTTGQPRVWTHNWTVLKCNFLGTVQNCVKYCDWYQGWEWVHSSACLAMGELVEDGGRGSTSMLVWEVPRGSDLWLGTLSLFCFPLVPKYDFNKLQQLANDQTLQCACLRAWPSIFLFSGAGRALWWAGVEEGAGTQLVLGKVSFMEQTVQGSSLIKKGSTERKKGGGGSRIWLHKAASCSSGKRKGGGGTALQCRILGELTRPLLQNI